MLSWNVTVWVWDPDVPVIVTVLVPTGAVAPILSVRLL